MSRRHRKHRRRHSGNRAFHKRKHSGWGLGLYRNTREGKVAGVAAGLADHWDIAHWVVRLMWVGAFLFTGTLAVWLYIGAWILMSPKPSRLGVDDDSYGEETVDEHVEMEYDERRHNYRPKKVFRYPDSSSERLRRARERMDAALRRVENMESYVTSRQYNLNEEFSKL
jgi:phage shock protein C